MEAIGEDGLRLTGSPKWQDLVSSLGPIRDAEMIFRDYRVCQARSLSAWNRKTIGQRIAAANGIVHEKTIYHGTSFETVPDDFVSRHLDDPLRLFMYKI